MDAIEKLAKDGALLTSKGWVYPSDDANIADPADTNETEDNS